VLSVGAPAWKCAARDRWIGWDLRHQYDRLHLIANNTRFLILPEHHSPNLASRILSLCERRLPQDWTERFGHPLWLLETFVDPRYFHGTIYRAANWEPVSISDWRSTTHSKSLSTRRSNITGSLSQISPGSRERCPFFSTFRVLCPTEKARA